VLENQIEAVFFQQLLLISYAKNNAPQYLFLKPPQKTIYFSFSQTLSAGIVEAGK
jgi:hypothetical protein